MEKILSKIKSSLLGYVESVTDWTSARMVYLLMSVILFIAWLYNSWNLVGFVVVMLNVSVWTRFCPSKWIFEKLGFQKTDL